MLHRTYGCGHVRSETWVQGLNIKFRNEWELKLANLVESVNESVEIVDFLATAQEHILKEIGDCVLAAEEKNAT